MSETSRGTRKLLTLTEVSSKTKISMPTLQRYKREYQDRIPSFGKGRKQRYPASALAVFKKLKEENLKRRGRPAKGAGAGPAQRTKTSGRRAGRRGKPTGSSRAGSGELLTLTEIEKRTGISYPTLLRYVDLHGDKIPHEGKGRKRRYRPEAVAIFKELRAASPRGRRKKSSSSDGSGALERKLRELEKAQGALAKQVRTLERRLDRPLRLTLTR